MENISFEDFAKLELRVGKIIEAEKVDGSDKLLKFTVSFGDIERTIISGVAEYYSPEETIGKQVSAVFNLNPKKMFDIESEGMILFAKNGNKPIFLSPEEDVVPGSIIS